MIKKELFQNKRMRAVAAAAALSASMSLSGCTSAVQTNAEIVTTSQVETEADTVAETPSSSIAETEEVKLQDTVAPTITVSNHRIEVVVGTDINLMDGVRASDDKGRDLTDQIVISEYDISALDVEQSITYSVSDEAGNEASATAILLIKSNPVEALDKTMYTTSSVNVRSGSNQDTEKLGSLAYAQSVHVTGRDKNTGWYQIDYNDNVGYISSSYLSDIKPAPKSALTTSTNKGGAGSSGSSSGDSDGSSIQAPIPDTSQPSSGSGFKIHEPGDIDKVDFGLSDEAIQHGW